MRCGGFKSVLMIVVFMVIISCRKPYNPPAISSPGSYLVVEGMINTGNDSTIIKLSYTVNLAAGVTTNPVTGAAVNVESSANNIYQLTETSNGNYTAQGLNLNNTLKYRLKITTTDGKNYLSDFVVVQNTPPIDSVGFMAAGNNLQLYVNTHNPANSTRYYRWDYQETWQFHAKYQSGYISNGSAIVPRTLEQSVYNCFGTNKSSTIILGSSAKLTQDVIYQDPLTSIASTSEKIETRYSILVREYALTQEAFIFWTSLKKNTEQLGSIFDAQPSEIMGNIHNSSNAAEPVIGYITAENVQSKRIFINYTQLPQTWFPTYPYQCRLDTFWYANPYTKQNDVAQILIPIPNDILPYDSFSAKNSPGTLGYLGSSLECIDCTIRGTKTTPSFWY